VSLVGTAFAGAFANVLSDTGEWIVRSAIARRGRPSERDRAIAAWFDKYELTRGLLDTLPLPDGIDESKAASWLTSHETQAVFHELITVELTDAPPTELDRVHNNLLFTCLDAFPDLDDRSARQFSNAVFDAADFELKEIVARLESGNAEFLARVREEALSGRLAAVLEAIERHANAYAPMTAADRVRDRQYITRYRRVAASEHGFLEPPDFEQRRRVPISKLYVVPDISRDPEEYQSADASRRVPIWQFADDTDRTVLLGDPGGGKSTAVNVLINKMADSTNGRTPFLIVLREYAKEDPPGQSVVGYIERRLETHYQCPAPPGLVDRLLLSGSAIVFFDGLDELVDTARRKEVTQRVENFSMYYPLASVIVTSRRIGYSQAKLEPSQFSTFQLAAFTEAQTKEYAEKWFSQERRLSDQEPAQWADAFARESAAVPDLRSNPLMLALLCILYRGEGSLPRNRPAVYERCSTLLFETWDSSRSVYVDLRVRDLMEPVLRHLAHWLLVRNVASPIVTEQQLTDETARYLQDRSYEDIAKAARAAREFVEFCKGRAWVFTEVGTSAEGEPLFTFSHRTFLEYFAASYLASTCDSPERLASVLGPHIARQEWDVVAQLALQIKARQIQDGGTRFYSALLSSRRYSATDSIGNLISFLARCLNFIDVPPAIVRDIVDRSFDHMLPDVHSRDRLVPLGWVMSVERAREIVSAYLAARLGELITKGDSSDSITAMHIVMAITTPLHKVQSSTDQARVPEYYHYWYCQSLSIGEIYRDRIVRCAANDLSLLIPSYERNFVTLRSMEGWPERPWHFLFVSDVPVGIGDSSFWLSPASMLIRFFASGGDDDEFPHWTSLEEVLDLVRALGPPPWGISESARLQLFPLRDADKVISLNPAASREARTGALLLLAILLDSRLSGRDIDGINFGHLSSFLPYIRHREASQRGEKAQANLEPLDVCVEFQDMFDAWAAGRLNFSARTTEVL
jgi:NACHT domain